MDVWQDAIDEDLRVLVAQRMYRQAKGRLLKSLGPGELVAVEAMTNALVKKLLHDTIARLKGADCERYAGTLRGLFALDGTPSHNDGADPPED